MERSIGNADGLLTVHVTSARHRSPRGAPSFVGRREGAVAERPCAVGVVHGVGFIGTQARSETLAE
jgi:hypothetical protein